MVLRKYKPAALHMVLDMVVREDDVEARLHVAMLAAGQRGKEAAELTALLLRGLDPKSVDFADLCLQGMMDPVLHVTQEAADLLLDKALDSGTALGQAQCNSLIRAAAAFGYPNVGRRLYKNTGAVGVGVGVGVGAIWHLLEHVCGTFDEYVEMAKTTGTRSALATQVYHGFTISLSILRLCLNEMSTHSFWRRLLFRKTHVYRVLISFKHSCRTSAGLLCV
jgi:hypothetical protein